MVNESRKAIFRIPFKQRRYTYGHFHVSQGVSRSLQNPFPRSPRFVDVTTDNLAPKVMNPGCEKFQTRNRPQGLGSLEIGLKGGGREYIPVGNKPNS